VAESKRKLFKVGELMRQTGYSRQQIQNFLVMKLVREEELTPGGHRLYGPEAVRRLKIIRGLREQGYPLTEIPRAFKGFFRTLGLLLALTLGFAAAATSAAAENVPAPLPSEDAAGIRKLFDDLGAAMKSSDRGRVLALLAPEIPPERVALLRRQVDAEFTGRDYLDFSCEFYAARDVEVLEADRVRVLAIVRTRYRDHSEPDAIRGDFDGQGFRFDLVRSGERWLISRADVFDTFSLTQGDIFNRIFLWAAVGLVVLCFWGWMLMDVLMRERAGRRWPWVLAMLAALAAAAAALPAYARHRGDWLLALAALPAIVSLIYFLSVRMRQPAEAEEE
jgi:hypothetical protein